MILTIIVLLIMMLLGFRSRCTILYNFRYLTPWVSMKRIYILELRERLSFCESTYYMRLGRKT